MIDPARSTVVAWYDALPEGLDRLVARVRSLASAVLGAAFAPRDPAQVHATLIGLERAAAPFDPGPLAAHLRAALTPPLTVQFGGFARADRRMLSRGLPLHDRGFGVRGPGGEAERPTGAPDGGRPAPSLRDGRVVLVGWPVVDGVPGAGLADVRQGCTAFGVTHRYGRDPDVHLVLGDVAAASAERTGALEAAVRHELAAAAVRVQLRADDLSLVTYDDPALPRASTSWRPLRPPGR